MPKTKNFLKTFTLLGIFFQHILQTHYALVLILIKEKKRAGFPATSTCIKFQIIVNFAFMNTMKNCQFRNVAVSILCKSTPTSRGELETRQHASGNTVQSIFHCPFLCTNDCSVGSLEANPNNYRSTFHR